MSYFERSYCSLFKIEWFYTLLIVVVDSSWMVEDAQVVKPLHLAMDRYPIYTNVYKQFLLNNFALCKFNWDSTVFSLSLFSELGFSLSAGITASWSRWHFLSLLLQFISIGLAWNSSSMHECITGFWSSSFFFIFILLPCLSEYLETSLNTAAYSLKLLLLQIGCTKAKKREKHGVIGLKIITLPIYNEILLKVPELCLGISIDIT